MDDFRILGSKTYAKKVLRFFKTGKGEYSEGDLFLGIRTPIIRKFAKDNIHITLGQTNKLIKSKFHEERLLGLIILVNKYKRSKSMG